MRLKLFVLIIITMFTQAGYALQLGKIQVKSTQNSPFDAQIAIEVDKGENLEQMQYLIASQEVYKSQGMQRQAIHSDIKINLAYSASKSTILVLKSTNPVKDSFLDLLIQIDSPQGKIFKEYTVLLDPPVIQKTNAPVGEVPSKDVVKTLQPKTQKEVNRNNSIVTKPGKTLFQIARENNISGITTEQYAVAVFQKNPNAFANNNINGLNKGQKITLPNKDYFNNLSHLEARKILRDQNIQWKKIKNSNSKKAPEKKQKVLKEKDSIELSRLKAEIKRLNTALDEAKVSPEITKADNSSSNNSDKSEKKLIEPDSKVNNEKLESTPAENNYAEIANQDFISSIAVEEEDIIEEVIMDDVGKTDDESRSGLVYILIILFAILGGLLVYLTKKRSALKILPHEAIRTSVDEYIYKKNITRDSITKF